jgi:hypothetical protein
MLTQQAIDKPSDLYSKGFIVDSDIVFIKIMHLSGQKGFIGTVEETKEFIDLLQSLIVRAEALELTLKGN